MTLKSGWQDSQILSSKDDWYKSPITGNTSVKIGIAGPPIKTPKGWLLIVHVVHEKGENMFNRVYSLGFMVLDLQNPIKIKYIYPAPILWPTEKYEIMGAVPVVCFSNATVDPGAAALYIYYGGLFFFFFFICRCAINLFFYEFRELRLLILTPFLFGGLPLSLQVAKMFELFLI